MRDPQLAGELRPFGQEINAETYVICKAYLLLKGESDAEYSLVSRWGAARLAGGTPHV